MLCSITASKIFFQNNVKNHAGFVSVHTRHKPDKYKKCVQK